jgi:hypothetical protein
MMCYLEVVLVFTNALAFREFYNCFILGVFTCSSCLTQNFCVNVLLSLQYTYDICLLLSLSDPLFISPAGNFTDF